MKKVKILFALLFCLAILNSFDGLNIEFGVEYLMGKERDVDYLKKQADPGWKTVQPGIYNMNVLLPNISVSFKF